MPFQEMQPQASSRSYLLPCLTINHSPALHSVHILHISFPSCRVCTMCAHIISIISKAGLHSYPFKEQKESLSLADHIGKDVYHLLKESFHHCCQSLQIHYMKTKTKMTGKTQELRSDKRKPREEKDVPKMSLKDP